MAANSMSLTEELTEFVIANAPRYLQKAPGERLEVRLVSGGDRVLSSLYRFQVAGGGETREMLIKLPGPADDGGERPRLVVPPDKETRAAFEYAALSAIEQSFATVNDTRFDSVRIFDFLDHRDAIVMEYKKCVPLTNLLLKTNRIQSAFSGPRPFDATATAGAWLKLFHTVVPALPHSKRNNDTRTKFVQHVERFTEFLQRSRLRSTRRWGRAFREIVDAANAHLPEDLPSGIGHGDFAPRNILIGADGRITVIDTRGFVTTSIYEDIGFFIGALRTNKLQALSRSAAYSASILDRQEQAFLRGYFGDEAPPVASIALFVIQALLDKWCDIAERVPVAGGVKKLVQSYTFSSLDWIIQRELERQLSLIRALD